MRDIHCIIDVEEDNLPKAILLLSSSVVMKYFKKDKVLVITDKRELMRVMKPSRAVMVDVVGFDTIIAESEDEIIVSLVRWIQ